MKKCYLILWLLSFAPILLFAQSNFTKSKIDNLHVGTACCLPAPQAVSADNNVTNNGNGVLGQSYNKSACGLNYVQGSVLIEQRSVPYAFNANGTGLPTSINITGLPANFIVDKAYLWYIASYYEAAVPSNIVTVTNPDSVTIISDPIFYIGLDGPKCWQVTGEVGTATYRCDVTTSISGNGTYQISVSGFTYGGMEIDGATMMIIYKDTTSSYQGSMIIFDGLLTSGSNNFYPSTLRSAITGLDICNNAFYAEAFLMGSDMQVNVNGGLHTDSLNGTVVTYNNDFWNFDVHSTTVQAGQLSTIISATDPSDCFTIGAIGLYYQDSCMACPTVASVKEIDNMESLIISPNPMNYYCHFQLNNSKKDAELVVFDMLGKTLLIKELNNGKATINKGDLEEGIYLVRISSGENHYTRKLIVQ